jgi:hypothetical protein
MTFRVYPHHQQPSGIVIPDGIIITPPAHDLPDDVKRFFGKTGAWWGSWRSPQTKDGFDTILIIRDIRVDAESDVVYVFPDYPPWYVTGGYREVKARFSRKTNGRISLLFLYEPFGYTMECWFENQTLKGAVHRRFMSAYIDLEPLKSVKY